MVLKGGLVSPPSLAVCVTTFGMHGILCAIWLRLSEAYHRLMSDRKATKSGTTTTRSSSPLIPLDVYSTDPHAMPLAPVLTDIMQSPHGHRLQSAHPQCLILWHHLCISLLGDPALFELGAGRDGAQPAKTALESLGLWAAGPAARRACVHAAQVFWICSNCRISDAMMLHSESALFTSALVLGLYVLVMTDGTGQSTTNGFELLADLDWQTVGNAGLGDNHHCARESANDAVNFIVNAGNLTFSGESITGGYPSARRILVRFAGLLEDAGRWRFAEIRDILHILSDVLVDDEGGDGDAGGRR
jgi:hypothetical protein